MAAYISIAVLFVICHQAVFSTHDFFYSELEYLGGSCYPSDSCTPPRKDSDDHLWGNYTCECGMHCLRYGTCCADSPHFGRSLHFEYLGEICDKLPGFSDAVVLVSQCSYKVRYGRQIREKCEGINSYAEDPVIMTPVTSLVTHVTYKNYFCALCNHDTRDVFIWNIRLRAKKSIPGLTNVTEDEILKNLLYNSDLKSWGIAKNNSFYQLGLKFVLPPSIQKFVKKCYPEMVTQCDPEYSYDKEMQYKCSSYYAPIRLKDSDGYMRYRNIHCAICNNVNASQIDESICKLEVDRAKTKPTFSFALLLDINRGDGDLVGKKKMCEDNAKWDPFFKKCRYLACGLPGYVLKEGKCVPS